MQKFSARKFHGVPPGHTKGIAKHTADPPPNASKKCHSKRLRASFGPRKLLQYLPVLTAGAKQRREGPGSSPRHVGHIIFPSAMKDRDLVDFSRMSVTSFC